MTILCSIIIRCFNEADHLDKLLCGISQQDQDMNRIEVIAVDSGSTDESPAIFRRYGAKVLSLDPERFSFGRSCNIGCEAARGEFIIFISGHAYPVYRNWLAEMLKPFDDQKVALSYGKQRGNGMNTYSERQIFKAWYPDAGSEVPAPPFCNNANSAIRRSVWEALRFDETLTGLEDIDFANRAIQTGYKVKYNPEAEIIHVHVETPGVVFNRYRREAIAYRRLFPDESFSLMDFFKLYTVNVVSDCYHAWFDQEFKNQCKTIFIFRLMQFWGVYKGMQQQKEVTGTLKRQFYYPAGLKRNTGVTPSAQDHFIIDYPE